MEIDIYKDEDRQDEEHLLTYFHTLQSFDQLLDTQARAKEWLTGVFVLRWNNQIQPQTVKDFGRQNFCPNFVK